ncbi:hypothetical protein ACPPVO_43605 [Dactylosporangium sp. McL0621]|uniref:hypothetical protein n=1 Tax=Dactylosporangium sp. McL0621 TaxID=3415678 RepID=UPI003CF3802C
MRTGLLTAAVFTAVALSACSSGGKSPSLPSLGGAGHSASPGSGGCVSAGAGQGKGSGKGSGGDLGYQPTCAGATSDARKNALHAAAECIRQHGVPTYKDPVLTADGHVYTDSHSLDEADENTVQAVEQACNDLILNAQLVPDGQAPAPPKLVQAG